jgi:hypothetical protein
MRELTSRNTSSFARFGGQPIAIGAAALAIVLLGIGSMTAWRAYTGTTPETDEKTKGLEATQQESIDQLQVVQDQLLAVRRLLAAQQADTRKLSEQVGTLTESIDGLRQSFASAQASEPATPPATRKRSAGGSARAKPHAIKSANRKRGKTQG